MAKAVRDDWDDEDDEEGEEPEKDVGGKEDGLKASLSRHDGTTPGSGSLGRGELGEAKARKVGEDSTKIWEEANKRGPMPELIVAPASTSQSSAPPPPAALQPTLRILKRPSPNTGGNNTGTPSSASLSSSSQGYSANSGSSSGVTSPGARGTLAEREVQYQEARSRIFGEKLGNAGGDASSVSISRASSTSGGPAGVMREPLGPALETDMMELGNGQDKARGGSARPAKGFGERRRGRK